MIPLRVQVKGAKPFQGKQKLARDMDSRRTSYDQMQSPE